MTAATVTVSPTQITVSVGDGLPLSAQQISSMTVDTTIVGADSVPYYKVGSGNRRITFTNFVNQALRLVQVGLVATPGIAFATDLNTGIAQLGGADTISLVAGGTEIIRTSATGVDVTGAFTVSANAAITGTLSATSTATFGTGLANYFSLAGAATGNTITFAALGSDSNIGIAYNTKGSGVHVFTGHLTLEGITSTGATGTGALVFATAPTVTTLTVSSGGAAITGTVAVTGGLTTTTSIAATTTITAGTGLTLTAGTFTVTSGTITTGAATGYTFASSGGTQLEIDHTALAVNSAGATGGATAAPAQFYSQGSDSAIQTNVYAKGAANIVFLTSRQATARTQFVISHTASAVNNIQVTGNATANNPSLTATGSDSNVGIAYTVKGSGVHVFTGHLTLEGVTSTGATGTGALVFSISPTFTGTLAAATGTFTGDVYAGYGSSGEIHIFAGGDTNSYVQNDSAGAIIFRTNNGTAQVRFAHTASAVNYITMNGAATASNPQFSAGNSSDSNTGIDYFTKGTGAHVFKTNSATRQFQVSNTGSAVNYWNMAGHTTGNNPYLQVAGSDTNVAMDLHSQGTGGIYLKTNAGSQTQVVVAHTASAVNYWQVNGAATLGNVGIFSLGSDTNIGNVYFSKGTGGHFLCTNGSSSTIQLGVTHTASAVNYTQWTGAATAGSPNAVFTGSDSNVSASFYVKGDSVFSFYTNQGTSSVEQFRIKNTSSAVNYNRVTGAATGSGPTLSAQGSDSNIAYNVATLGTGAINFLTNTSAQQLQVAHRASADTYIFFQGATTAQDIQVGVTGSQANMAIQWRLAGTGGHKFMTSGTTQQMTVTDTASAVNWWVLTGHVVSSYPPMSVAGSDTNIGALFTSKGTGPVVFYTNTSAQQQFAIAHAASAVNYLQATGAATAGVPVHSAQGSDTNVALGFATKGTGALGFYTNTNVPQVVVNHTASAVNYIQLSGNATTGKPGMVPAGSDTDIGMFYGAKGTGAHVFYTNNNGSTVQVQIANVTSAVNYLQFSGSASTASFAQVMAAGSDTNVQISFVAKAAGGFDFLTTTGSTSQFQVVHTASAVNRLTATGSATGAAVLLIPTGTDSNVRTDVRGKGTGSGSGVQIEATSGRVGFMGATPVARPAVTGSKATGAALSSLLTELANLGLITDSTSA